MSTPPEPDIPRALVATRPRRNLPLVWIVPLVAALVGLWLVAQNLLAEGPLIQVRFHDAEGIEPGHTKIRYKNVDVGEVKNVAVSKDRKEVIVTARLVREARDFLASDTRFWVVRPRITAGNVSGLGTLLSGAYIGVDVGNSTETSRDFVGLEVPPIVTGDLPGRQFVLHGAEIGSLDVGAPVNFRRVPVGQIVAFQLDPDGKGVTLRIFIHAPYDQFVTENTRFWHASGIDLSLDANGLRLQTQSLASIVEGGLAFQTPSDEPVGARAAAETVFTLYSDRERAMRRPDNERHRFVAYFKESLRGLAPGAPVDFHGIVMGEVKSLGVEFSPHEGLFRFPVVIDIYPDRMRARYVAGSAQPKAGDAANHVLVDQLVAAGMRAQLKPGNLLTGQQFVALDFHRDAAPARVDWTRTPPVLPSVPGGLGEIQDSVASILKKVDRIPIEQLSGNLVAAIRSLNKTLEETDVLMKQLNTELVPEAKALLGNARGALGDARKALDEDAPLQGDLREALRQTARSAEAVRSLADFLERHPETLLRGRVEAPPASVRASPDRQP
jgi:paraquat-inducible protein B